MTGTVERRRSRRHDDHAGAGLRSVRLRTGHPAAVVNWSAGGASIETAARLAPGKPADVVMVFDHGTVAARSLVVYSRVCGVHATKGARYRIGLCLDHAAPGGPLPGWEPRFPLLKGHRDVTGAGAASVRGEGRGRAPDAPWNGA